MAESCKFGNLKKEMIQDRLVIGIRDAQLSERLQLEPNLTLTKAEKLICRWHAVSCKTTAFLEATHTGHQRTIRCSEARPLETTAIPTG